MQCEAWHQLTDNLNLIDEVRFIDDDGGGGGGGGGGTGAAGGDVR